MTKPVIIALLSYKQNPLQKTFEQDHAFFHLNEINLFARSTYRESIQFVAHETVKRMDLKQNAILTLKDIPYRVFAAPNPTGDRVSVVVTTQTYSDRVAYALLQETNKDPSTMKENLVRYQDVAAVDKIIKIQKDLDEIKTVMYQNMEQMMNRGESLDSLVQKSHQLSINSKLLFDNSRRLNRCCVIV